MPPATNTFTVAVADAHSNTVSQGAIPANNKADALRSCFAGDVEQKYAALTPGDTWTVTVTQP